MIACFGITLTFVILIAVTSYQVPVTRKYIKKAPVTGNRQQVTYA